MIFANRQGGRLAPPFLVGGAFLFLFVLQSILLIPPVLKDAQPRPWDESVHLRSCWKYRSDLAHGNFLGILHPPQTPGHPPYPPLTHLVMAGGTWAADLFDWDPEDGAALANLLFLMLLGWGAYLLASDLWGEEAGVAAAFLVSLSPPLVSAARSLLVDVALTAWVVLAYAVWVRSRRFSLWLPSLALGLVGAAGMLTKWTFVFYVLPIMASGVWTLYRPPEAGARLKVAAAFLTAGFLAAPWYGVNLVNTVIKTSRSAAMGVKEGDPVGGWGSWVYYAKSFQVGWGWSGVIVGLAGGYWLVIRHPVDAMMLGSWLSSSYLFWTFLVSNKDPRYMLPGLIALPFAASSLPFRIPLAISLLLAGTSLWSLRSVDPRPSWPLKDIVQRADALRAEPEGPPAVLTLLANHVSLSGNTLLWAAESEGVQDRIIVRSRSSRLGEFSEFVLVKTGDLGPPRTVAGHEKLREEALRPDGWFQKYFERAAEWALPDGGQAILFHRRPAASSPRLRPDIDGVLSALIPKGKWENVRGDCAEGEGRPGVWNCEAAAGTLWMKGLALTDVKARLGGLRSAVNDDGSTVLLDLSSVQAESLRLTEPAAASFLSARVKPLKKTEVRFLPDNGLEAKGRFNGLPVRLGASIRFDPVKNEVSVDGLSARLLGLPLPLPAHRSWSLEPKRGWPFRATLAGLRIVPSEGGEPGRLEVVRD